MAERIALISQKSIANWDKSGKIDFLESCKECLKSSTGDKIKYENVSRPGESDIKRLLYELCLVGVKGQLKIDQVVATFTEIASLYPSITLLLADVFGVLDIELSCYDVAESRGNFINLLIASQVIVPESLLKERLDLDVLEALGLLQSKTIYQQKYVKTKTKLYYKQQKFNLLREEPEGYAKLITELCQEYNSDEHSKSASQERIDDRLEAVLERVKSLIGCFNLDPNRVLDIILEVFECRPEKQDFFIPLLSKYTLDPTTLCHILGFKFQFYQQTADSVTEASLYHMTAQLIQHNLISLDALLSPSDSEMMDKYKKELTEAKQHHLKLNVLGTMVDKSIGDDNKENNTSTTATTTAAASGNNSIGSNNTVAASTGSGANNEKDRSEDNDVTTTTTNINNNMNDWSASVNNNNNQKLGLCGALIDIGDWAHAQEIISMLPPFTVVSHPTVCQSLCRLIKYIIQPLYDMHCGLPLEILSNQQKKSSSPSPNYPPFIERATEFEHLPLLAFPLISQLGPYLYRDPILLVKINRIAKTYMTEREKLKQQQPQQNRSELTDVFCGLMTIYDESILPSLSLMPGNCCVSEELWGFIKTLRYEHRYRLYGQWKNESRLHNPVLLKAHAEVLHKSKYIMKRLAKENVKPLGRQIGKLSHSAPGVVFEHILSQIQRYDNFIIPVVDSLKFLTSLSYDVLIYCIIEALANPERERMKTDGTNISTWLQSLANFSGSVLKKYQVDIAGLLHYILNQMKAGKSYDLYVLREVIQKMAGIEVSEEVTDDQLMAMAGGELLKQEGGYFTQVRNTKKPSSRLMDCLTEHNLTIPLCLMMSQQRNAIIFQQPKHQQLLQLQKSDGLPDVDNRHVKLVGKLYDQCQDTLVQFISFLLMQTTTDEMRKKLPNIHQLSTTYFISSEVAFSLWRGIYTADINAKVEELRRQEKKDKASPNISSQSLKIQRYYEAVESVMSPLRTQLIEPMMTPKLWEELNIQFYTTFWSLELYDLEVPNSTYENQIKMHQTQLQVIEDNKDLAQSKKKKEKERCTSLIEKLTEEQKKQEEHVKMVMARLNKERDVWFSTKLAKHSTITAILQYCLFPRSCFTAIDAVYCAKFLYMLHNLKTSHFSSLICYDRIFSDITWTLSSCTENEAHRYGRFLCCVLNDIMRWHSDKNIYDRECANYPGFVTVFRSPNTTSNAIADNLDYENFRHVVHKWHYSITRVAVNCLESSDYIQIRNMIIVLTKILSNYPRVMKLGAALERRVEKVVEVEKEKRQDLYVLALAYLGQLKSTKKHWVQDYQFHKKEAETQQQQQQQQQQQAPMLLRRLQQVQITLRQLLKWSTKEMKNVGNAKMNVLRL
ncbi:hypothetical protein HELRODRAFT_191720 [Helobdella robusta]|uniref:THO complex subunit 2 n=1 Tax=Helobdella robusta TaxID=6412 RepID=T1FT82_HELRO|nr:hypothetical protein HELRODRAFT_191720 [Helobdella robusta]ESO04771.1 hypothetical protein HELRODRAFT_191720 [Helobdella robusta]